MRYYKVVDELTSSICATTYRLQYGVGRRTLPEIGGVLAFETLGAARFFARGTPCICSILQGTGEQIELPPYCAHSGVGDYEAAWNGTLPECNQCSWPLGTVALAWFEGEEVVE